MFIGILGFFKVFFKSRKKAVFYTIDFLSFIDMIIFFGDFLV